MTAADAAPDDAGTHDGLADEPVAVRIVASDRVFEGRVWDLRRDTFEYRGEPVVRDYVDHTGAVAVLAIDHDDRVLLVQQYRHPVGVRDWEIPAGLLDVAGEHPLAAARRELAEEADLEADDWAVLLDLFTSPGGSDEAIRIYLARGIRPTARPYPRTEEEADILARWVRLDEAVDAALDRRIANAPLVAAVLAAQAFRARGWAGLGDAEASWPYRGRGDARR